MKIKSYFAKTIQEAIEKARLELGSDAMIVASNRTSGEAQQLGTYEVVFGVTNASNPQPAKPQPVRQEPAAPAPSAATRLEKLQMRMNGLRESVSKKRELVTASKMTVSLRISAALAEAGIASDIAAEIGDVVQSRVRGGSDWRDCMEGVKQEISSRVRVSPKLGNTGKNRTVIVLVGPPGSGKTTTAVKLAVKYGIVAKRPVRFISTDTFRLGGPDLLRRYAQAMNAKFEAPSNPDKLDRALKGSDAKELVIVDTPPIGSLPADRESALAALLARRSDTDVHLVLPAMASRSDFTRIAKNVKAFLPSKLLFTGMDLTENYGGMISWAIAQELPVSFLATGPRVPEDLEEASIPAITGRLIPTLQAAAASAA